MPQHACRQGDLYGRGLSRSTYRLEHIEEKIRTGELLLESTLLSEPDMTHRYGVAINTVRRAVPHLWEQGIVDAVPTKETFGIAVPEK